MNLCPTKAAPAAAGNKEIQERLVLSVVSVQMPEIQ